MFWDIFIVPLHHHHKDVHLWAAVAAYSASAVSKSRRRQPVCRHCLFQNGQSQGWWARTVLTLPRCRRDGAIISSCPSWWSSRDESSRRRDNFRQRPPCRMRTGKPEPVLSDGGINLESMTLTSAPQFGHILRDLPESLFIGKWSKTRNIHEKIKCFTILSHDLRQANTNFASSKVIIGCDYIKLNLWYGRMSSGWHEPVGRRRILICHQASPRTSCWHSCWG